MSINAMSDYSFRKKTCFEEDTSIEPRRTLFQDTFCPIQPRENPQQPRTIPSVSAPLGANLTERLRELGFDVLRGSESDRLFRLTDGTPFGIWFSEKVYDANDDFVQNAPLRKKISKRLLEEAGQSELSWMERAGVIHVGGQISAFFPIASFPPASLSGFLGFAPEAILRYRTLSPELYPAGSPRSDHHERFLHLPLTPALAMQMQPGCEVELIGQVKSGFSAGIAFVAGQAVGPALMGLGAFISSSIAGAKELGICVLALEKKGHVRITIRDLKRTSASFSLRLVAGVLYQITRDWASDIGSHFAILPAPSSTLNYMSSFSGLTTASMGIGFASEEVGVHIASIELDLNRPEAQSIYKHLLLLEVSKASKLVQNHPHCAKMALAKEVVREVEHSSNTSVMTDTLMSDRSTKSEMSGEFSFGTGETIFCTDKSVIKASSFRGLISRSIKWQEVEVKNSLGQTEPYFRLTYRDTDNRYKGYRFHEFFRFAKALAIKPEELSLNGFNAFQDAKDAVAKSNHVETRFDFFFSKNGIQKLLNADICELQKAYLQASATINFDYDGCPLFGESELSERALDLISKYELHLNHNKWDVLNLSPRNFAFHRDYKKLTNRDLSIDFGLLDQARNFANLVKHAQQKAKSQSSAPGLFLNLARKKKYDFVQTIAALVQLCGREEVRVHDFLLKSVNNVAFQLKPEKKLPHPEETFAEHLLSESFSINE